MLAYVEGSPLTVHLRPVINLTDGEFFEFCQLNRDLRFERTAHGDLVIMTPTGWNTSRRNAKIVAQLEVWATREGSGVASDSSGGFRLPNGAVRAPDAAWVARSRLLALTADQTATFLPLCPDFVVELRSPSDDLRDLQVKMEEYRDNGARLGWLIDPEERRVHVYRLDGGVTCLEQPAEISGDPVLPGFVLDLRDLWP